MTWRFTTTLNNTTTRSIHGDFRSPAHLSVLRSREGIGAALTPVSKRFAPVFASTHSLVANKVKFEAEKTLLE